MIKDDFSVKKILPKETHQYLLKIHYSNSVSKTVCLSNWLVEE